MAAVAPGSVVVALDECGDTADSARLARRLSDWQDGSVRDLAFLIGGADGLDDAVRAHAHWILSFGRLTWPHLDASIYLAKFAWL